MSSSDSKAEERDSVAVFAPSPLLTVTIEAGPGDARELHLHAGGQGFWVARMVARLGVPVALCCPLGGDAGRVLKVLIEAEGVDSRGVQIAGSNGSYVHDRRGGGREVVADIPGARLTRHEVDDLYDATLVAALDAGLVVLTGQFPARLLSSDVYRRLALDLRSNGCTVVADLSGEDLEKALEGGVDMLKVSHEQLLNGGYLTDEKEDSVVEVMNRLVEQGASNIVVSRSERSALARIDGQLLEILFPRIEAADYRGGGDSMTAALAVGLARGEGMPSVLRRAAAAGSLNVTRHGLGTGRAEDIESLSRQIEVREYRGA